MHNSLSLRDELISPKYCFGRNNRHNTHISLFFTIHWQAKIDWHHERSYSLVATRVSEVLGSTSPESKYFRI